MQLAWMLAPLLVIMGALDQLVLLQVLEWVHFNQLRQFLLLLSLMQLGKLLPLLLKLLVLQVDKLQALNLGLDLVTMALVLYNHKLDHEGPNLMVLEQILPRDLELDEWKLGQVQMPLPFLLPPRHLPMP